MRECVCACEPPPPAAAAAGAPSVSPLVYLPPPPPPLPPAPFLPGASIHMEPNAHGAQRVWQQQQQPTYPHTEFMTPESRIKEEEEEWYSTGAHSLTQLILYTH